MLPLPLSVFAGRKAEADMMKPSPSWPDIPLQEWSESCETLHRWTQVVGKVRMALTPLVNHWWNVTLYVTSRGLTTSPISHGGSTFEIILDFLDHHLRIETSEGDVQTMKLEPMTVADFYNEFMKSLRMIGIDVHIWTMPSEIEHAVPFDKDRAHAQYDGARVQNFWRALVQSDRVFKLFRTPFLGKVSPVHFFWGSFDLAVTRFSGRSAPLPTGHPPNVALWANQEGYSHEVCSCGFWPGNGGYGKPAFFAYAYPESQGYAETAMTAPAAAYDNDLGLFILPYDAVRRADDPDGLLLGFLQETYEAAADLGKWDRKALERPTDDVPKHRSAAWRPRSQAGSGAPIGRDR
jgi:hypothetical protein